MKNCLPRLKNDEEEEEGVVSKNKVRDERELEIKGRERELEGRENR